jgi:hypothetical protein
LKKEKNLFINNVGQYSALTETDKNKLLVERLESIVSSETSKYFTIHHPQSIESKSQPPELKPTKIEKVDEPVLVGP